MSADVLNIENLEISFPDGRKVRCDGLQMPKGAKVALVVDSGAGKTSFFYALAGLLHQVFKVKGKYSFHGQSHRIESLDGPPKGMRIVLQGKHLLHPLKKLRNQGYSAEKAVAINLSKLGIPLPELFLSKYPNQVSGGQKQRFMIAEAFLPQTELVLLDEPTFGLDAENAALLIHFLKASESAVFIITHDVHFAKQVADKIFSFQDGLIIPWKENSSTEQTPTLQPAGKQLFEIKKATYYYKTRGFWSKPTFRIEIPFFEIHNNECIGLYGASGTGKTTFLQFLAKTCKDSDISYRYIYQDATSSFDASMTILESLQLVSLKPADYEVFMQKMNLDADLLHKTPSMLSGGECQRFSICRALALGADILLMDEPLSAVDAKAKHSILHMLLYLLSETSIVLVSHDIQTIRPFCHRVFRMKEGTLHPE